MSTSTSAHRNPVTVERRNAALILTICRPEAGNSISLATAEGLSAGLKRAAGEPGLRAVVITGQGGKFFCTGGDVKAYRALDNAADLEKVFGRVRNLLDEIEQLSLPVIAAIDGFALGGGLEMALACDLRFATPHSKLGLPQAKLGLIPGWNGIKRLIETVGKSHAMRILYTAEPVTAVEAYRIGLVNDIAEQGSALDSAMSFVDRLSSTAPLGIEGAKAACMAALRLEDKESKETARRIFGRLWFTADHREAERAFAEKRKPQFKGG